jgi:hypothetical protein
MKVEIELEDLQALKITLEKRNEQLRKADEYIASLDALKLKEDALQLGRELFEKLVTKTIQSLGFQSPDDSALIRSNLYFKPRSYDAERLLKADNYDVELVVELRQAFKTAILHLGVAEDAINE